MRVLHPGVFPIRQLQQLCPGSVSVEQEIVRHRIDMREHTLLHMSFDEGPQREHPLLHRRVIPVYGRSPAPQALIELDLIEYVKRMLNFQSHLMEAPQPRHASPKVLLRVRVAHPDTFQIARDLVSGLRVDVDRVVTQPQPGDRSVNFCFLMSVDQLICPLAGHPHDILAVSHREQERAVGHSLLEHLDLPDLLRAAIQSLSDHIQHIGSELIGFSIQLPELLICVDLHIIGGGHYFGRDDHTPSLIQCFLPKSAVFTEAFTQSRYIPTDGLADFFLQIGDADHSAACRCT